MATPLKGAGFVRRLWSDKPEIAGSLVLFGLGIVGLGVYGLRYDRQTFHKHRDFYTVIRKEDANPECVKKDVYN